VISDESNVYDAVMRLMDQVEQVDRKVTCLMSAAGVEAPEPLPADEAA
jgi:hypothetical protein